MTKGTIVVDLEGTLTHQEWRNPILKIDEPLFHKLIECDEPNQPIIDNLSRWVRDFTITILTAKPERYRDDALRWLRDHDVKYTYLVMKHDQYSDWTSPTWKCHVIEDMVDMIVMFIDDRPDVIDEVHYRYPSIIAFQAGGTMWQK